MSVTPARIACTEAAAHPAGLGETTVAAASMTPEMTATTNPLATWRYGSVRISCPAGVTSRVCSNCAVRLRSLVTAVQLSGHRS